MRVEGIRCETSTGIPWGGRFHAPAGDENITNDQHLDNTTHGNYWQYHTLFSLLSMAIYHVDTIYALLSMTPGEERASYEQLRPGWFTHMES